MNALGLRPSSLIAVCGSLLLTTVLAAPREEIGAGVSPNGLIGAAAAPNTLTLHDNVPGGLTLWVTNGATTNYTTAIRGDASTPSPGITYGVEGWSNSPQGAGIHGVSYATTGYGVLGQATGTYGTGVVGFVYQGTGSTTAVRGYNGSAQGIGVQGISTATTSASYGGYFLSHSPTGFAVYGVNAASTGSSDGVYGRSDSSSGRAVVGYSSHATGATYAVIGWCDSPNGYGVWAQGRLGASGTKSFRIDHPSDPANKYLYHYSTEGPQPLNVYGGTVTTDKNGEAWIELPDYFEAINRDYRYQLTVVEDADSASFVQAKVAREIRRNRFKIRTSAPATKVSWEVKGVRNDLWIRENGAPVVQPKAGAAKGRYVNPQLYKKAIELGVLHRGDATYRAKALEVKPPPRRAVGGKE